LLTEGPALGHPSLGPLGVPGLAQLPDLLAQLLDAGPHLVPPGAGLPLAGVELEDLVELVDRVTAPPGQPGADGVGFGAEAADVQHGAARYRPRPARRPTVPRPGATHRAPATRGLASHRGCRGG